MNFFGMGPGELILILIVALIVFGPGKLPEIGSALGKSIREFRRATSEMTRELTDSMNEVKRPINEIKQVSLMGDAPAIASAGTEKICPRCSTRNPLSNKFCGHCGAELQVAEVAEE